MFMKLLGNAEDALFEANSQPIFSGALHRQDFDISLRKARPNS
jgi:hypothetical protein